MEKKIVCVSKGDEIGETRHGEPRHVKYLLTITYEDASETSVDADGECVAYLSKGFLVKANGRYQFYDIEGRLVADKDMSQYGDCVEIAVLNDLYIFDTLGDNDRVASEFVYGKNRFVIDVCGEVVPVPESLIGWPINQLYTYWDEDEDEEPSEEDMAWYLEYGVDEGTPLNLNLLRSMIDKTRDASSDSRER